MARLPDFLTRISPVGETLEAIGSGQTLLEEETALRNDQLSVATAGEGLSLWERDYSLTDGSGLSEEVRRSRVHTAMAGGRTLTRERMAALAVTVGGADSAQVEEIFAQWQVSLTARYENRMPGDMAALAAAVERLKPAHLEVEVIPLARVAPWTGRYIAHTGGVFCRIVSREGG